MMEVPAKVRRRLTSVKRAREPYDAEWDQTLVWLGKKEGGGVGFLQACLPRLSAAITTPSLNLTPSTEVPVTAGDWVWVCGNEDWRSDESYGP